jgi:two-component system OmpR family response regulator
MNALKILVVEDDPAIAGLVSTGLEARGYRVDHAGCGRDALVACHTSPYDVVVLDRMLPDMTGLAVLNALREEGVEAPVLVLSALASVENRVEGLVGGADDYLAKPFDMSELSARLMALCRRRPQDHAAGDLSAGALRLISASHCAALDKATAQLNRKQFSLLAFLMRHADRLVTRSMLLENVWGYEFDPATNIVESNMSRLRSRLQTLGCDPIETRRGEGYVLRTDLCS